ncbi:MAG: C40 family peptidase [Lachnospiraceae bacterium]|nr:C40 family peptidase [Lachnospiraceae bacterium]
MSAAPAGEAYAAGTGVDKGSAEKITIGLLDGPDISTADAEDDGSDESGSTVKDVLSLVGTPSLAEAYAAQEAAAAEAAQTTREILDESEASAGAGTLFGRKTEEEYLAARADAEGASWGYTNLGISNVSDNLNIRAIPGEDGKLVGKLPKDAACEVLETEGDWTHIISGEVDGYVKSEYLLTGLQAKMRVREFATDVVKVGTDGLRVREEPSTDAPIVTQVATGEILDYVGTEGDWVAVMLDDETVYVSADYVEITSDLRTALTMTEVLYGEGVSDVRADLCNYALQFVGNPYVWGGTSLTRGADCSGFVLSVFKKYGITLPHSSRAQANMGTTISYGEAKAGDLVFYGNGRRINHVGIYLGGGRVVHASNPRTGIRVSNVGYRTPVKFVRVLYD